MYEIFAQLLQAHQVTPYQVHKATGVAQSSLSDWKSGKSTPKYDKMKKIAEFFGVSVEYLAGDSAAPAEASAPEQAPPVPDRTHDEDAPIITRIARNGKKMPPEQQEKLLRLAQAMFPEYFDDDEAKI